MTLGAHLLAGMWAATPLLHRWNTGINARGLLQRQTEAIVVKKSHPTKGESRLLTQSDLTAAFNQALAAQLGAQRLVVKGDLDELKGELKGDINQLKLIVLASVTLSLIVHFKKYLSCNH